MKILIITPHYYPEQFNITEIAEFLAQDNNVTVWTAIPDYPEGKFYDGYGVFRKRKESINKVLIHRIFVIPRLNNILFLILNYISFLIFSSFKAIFHFKKYDIILNFQISPVTICIPGIILGKIKSIPVITYVQDIWPDSVKIAYNFNDKNFIYKSIKFISKYVYIKSNHLFCSSKLQIEHLQNNYNIDITKFYYVPNFSNKLFEDKVVLNDNIKLNNLDSNVIKIMFAGNIGKAQNLGLLVKISSMLKKEKKDDIHFILIGNGSEKSKLITMIKDLKVEQYFTFIDRQPIELIPSYYKLANILYVSLSDKSYLNYTLPSKIQTYMAMQKPIFAVASGETKRVLTEYKHARVVDNYDIKNIYNELLDFIYNIDEIELNNDYYKNEFSRSKILKKINNIMKEIVEE